MATQDGICVFAVYQPRPGKAQELEALLASHTTLLRQEGFATKRPALILKASDDSYLEIFEWKSDRKIEEAHTNEKIKSYWGKFEAVAEYKTLGDLPEAKEMFANFTALDALSN